MTALTSRPAAPAALGTRRGGGFVGLAWLTWRQHRWMIMIALLGFGLLTAYLLWVDHEIATLAASCDDGCQRAGARDLGKYVADADMALSLPGFASPLVGVFVAAPLVSREYEQRTNLLVWSQDVRATHWLAAKTALLASLAAVLAGMVGFAASALAHRLDGLHAKAKYVGSSDLFSKYFEATPLMQVGYMLLGFALGLVISLLARRTVPAMGITLAVFVATRSLVGSQRRYFISPIRSFKSLGEVSHDSIMGTIGDGGLYVSGGYADAVGNPVSRPPECIAATITAAPRDGSGSQDLTQVCLRDHGIASYYIDYQPASRLSTFHLVEEAIFVGLAVVLFMFSWWRIRRATTIG